MISQHKNIQVFKPGTGANEPTICINPKNTNVMLAGSNLDLQAYSIDAGLTWNASYLTSELGVWGDPVIIADTNSDFYYFHLSSSPEQDWLDRIICQKTSDTCRTWSDSSYTLPDGRQHDKEWAVVDKRTNHIYLTWTAFDKYGSHDPSDSSHILFAKSTDNGLTWTVPVRIDDRGGDCIDDDNTVEGAVPAVGPNGEVYVCWSGHGKLYFDKSTDGGQTWLPHDLIIADQYGGWVYEIYGLYRCNGLPVITCDLSGGKYHGDIYINYSDQLHGIYDTDLWLIKSTDGGSTWSKPKRVNDDPPGKQQFLTWMTIDQTNGFLYFVFYDRRNSDEYDTDVYMAVSKDGGDSLTNFKISEKSFVPNASAFLGDYTNIAAHDGVIRPAWTRMDFTTSVWTAIVNPDSIRTDVAEHNGIFNDELEQNYPNPFSHLTYVPFKIRNDDVISLKLYDSRGVLMGNIIDNVSYPKGKHTVTIDTMKLKLESGVYFYVLRTMHGTISKKLITIR